MTRIEFDALVGRVEARFAKRPVALRLQIAALVLAGYTAFLAEMLVALAILAGCVIGFVHAKDRDVQLALAVFGGIVFFLGVIETLRVLRVRIPPPEGREVRREEAPALFAMLDELRTRLRAAPFHRVLVDPRCNAGVQQNPRLGVFGWARNYLTLGLPLLEAMSADEVRAVLAHELAHLSARHGRFGNWLYRLRSSWEQMFARDRMRQRRGKMALRALHRKFIAWFWPRFNAHAFVLSRANEYEADAEAARLTDPALCASSLLRVQYYDRLLSEKFWPAFWNEANRCAEPPAGVFLRLRGALHTNPMDSESVRWVEQAFRTVTSNADTHPAMADRLRSMGFAASGGVFPPPPEMPQPSAADVLLGPVLGAIREELEKQWRAKAADAWREAHARAHSLQHRIESIGQGAVAPGDDADSLWDQADAKMRLENDAAAEPLLRRLLAIQPLHKAGNFCLGRRLLATGDAAGEVHLERAMEADETLVQPGCELLIGFHRSHGRTERVRELERRLDEHEAALAASQRERNTVTAADDFLPHDLPDSDLAPLLGVLGREFLIRTAWLARKRLAHFPRQRLFVLVVDAGKGWFGGGDGEDAVVNRLISAVQLPGRVLVVPPRGVWRALARNVRAAARSVIFERGRCSNPNPPPSE